MRLNYFLRGLGIGIVIATLILTISHSANRKMSDSEVIQRAGELGMTFGTQAESASREGTTTVAESSEEETTSVNGSAENETTQPVSTEGGTEDVQTAPSEKESETATTGSETESQTEKNEITTTQEETKQAETTQPEIIQIESSQESTTNNTEGVVSHTLVVVVGMSSNAVCNALYENGIIDNAADFDKYLVNNGLAEKIRVGSFEVYSDMSYEELAAILCY